MSNNVHGLTSELRSILDRCQKNVNVGSVEDMDAYKELRLKTADLLSALSAQDVDGVVEVIDPYVMDLVREHGATMTNSEIVRQFLPKERLSPLAQGGVAGMAAVPREPTDAQCVNGASIIQRSLRAEDVNDLELAASIYRVMTRSAAPASPLHSITEEQFSADQGVSPPGPDAGREKE